jgi:hypothetical protein
MTDDSDVSESWRNIMLIDRAMMRDMLTEFADWKSVRERRRETRLVQGLPLSLAPITRPEPALIIWREPSGSSLIPASRCKAHF